MYVLPLSGHGETATLTPSLNLAMTLARQVAEGEETQSAMMVIDTAGCEMGENKDEAGSTYNEGEALVVQVHVERLLAAGLPQAAVAVITPYNAQVSERERGLGDPCTYEVKGSLAFKPIPDAKLAPPGDVMAFECEYCPVLHECYAFRSDLGLCSVYRARRWMSQPRARPGWTLKGRFDYYSVLNMLKQIGSAPPWP